MNTSKPKFVARMAINAIKKELRKWYGMLSVEELVGNHKLVERMLAMRGV